jgi:glycine amidinotransferase
VERATEELEGVAHLLAKRGVAVRRPTPLDTSRPLSTPHFGALHQYGATCPRDVMVTVGSEIIEAPMSRRARAFEHLAYRDIVLDCWRRDPEMTWTVAPKPSMADAMYRPAFWELDDEQRYRRMHDFEFCISQEEIVFDAADIARLGRDVVVQESMTTNRAGIEWLRRHLSNRGVRVWPVHFPLDRFPSHIDCTFVPLRPGLVLTNPDRPMVAAERNRFEASGWQFVDAPRPALDDASMPPRCQSSTWLSMNVLSLDARTVVCEEQEHPLIDLLLSLDFDVLAVPFRNVYEFGGSLHCATWDLRRRGEPMDALA